MLPVIPLPYKILAFILLIGAIYGIGFYKGSERQKLLAQAEIIKQQQAAADLAEERNKVNTVVEKVFIDRVKTVYVTKDKTKEALNEVHTDIIVPVELVRLYNNFVRQSSGDAGASSESNAAADEVERNLKDVFSHLIDNAFTAEQNRIQLEELQSWIRKQQELNPK